MQIYDLTSSWQKVFDGSASNVVLQASDECMVYFGGASAPVENPAIGIKLQKELAGRVFFASGMTGVNIWAKEYDGFATTKLTEGHW